MEEVVPKIAGIIEGAELVRILYFLSDNLDNATIATLVHFKDNDKVFRLLVERMQESAKKCKIDKKLLLGLVDQCPQTFTTKELVQTSVFICNFNKALSCLNDSGQALVRQQIKELANKHSTIAENYTFVGTTEAIYDAILPPEMRYAIQAWFAGELSGSQSASMIAGPVLALGAGIIGVTLPLVALGFSPRTIGVSVVGGISATLCVRAMCTKVLPALKLPLNTSLCQSYEFMGLEESCTNGELNAQYRRLSLAFHPDKGGPSHMWESLQVAHQIIKLSRENKG
jgi:hypothetical protein